MNIHQFVGPPIGGTASGKNRQRAAKACLSCAESKLRCEGDKPCRRCEQRGLPCRFPRKSHPGLSTRRKASCSIDKSQLATLPAEIVVFSGSTNHEFQSAFTPSVNRIENDSHSIPGSINTIDPTELQVPSGKMLQELQNSSANQSIAPLSIDKGKPIILGPNTVQLQQPSSTDFSAETSCLGLLDAPGDELGWSWDALNLDILDFGSLETQPLSAVPPERDDMSEADRNLSMGESAYKQSFLLWTPREGEGWSAKIADLLLALDEMMSASVSADLQQHTLVHLQPSTRYRILSLVLSFTDSADHCRLLSSFPSIRVLEYLLSMELAEQSREADCWLHVPSFDPNTASMELVIGLIAAGAFRSDSAVFLKFALALHELHRELIAYFQGDPRNIRMLGPVQSFMLLIQAGLQSGDSRRIEISEGMFSMPITMIRRGDFLRLPYPEGISPELRDNNLDLKKKWFAWVEHESKKRLVLHLLILSTQHSMVSLTPPPLTGTEMHNGLPAALELWKAPSAEAWRVTWLKLGPSPQLSIRACIEDPSNLSSLGNSVDIRYTAIVVLSGLWSNTWQYKERLKACGITPGATQNTRTFSTQALYQEARESLESFATTHMHWLGPMDPWLAVLHERQLMYLHVSLEDLQLLGGKDGEHEARRVFPQLKEWAQSRSCRQAMWHAGQILREARGNGDSTLKVSTVLGIYHASLILWSYSIISKAQLSNSPADQNPQLKLGCPVTSSKETEIVLDGYHTPLVQHFLASGVGKPCITQGRQGTDNMEHLTIEVICQPETMAVFQDLLREKYMIDYRDCPNLVGNLVHLIGKLGQAAELVQRRQF
ncbi:hypothetical protein J3E72DRAFT_231447 [Bipolaris maydis]|nr:hypothetical protein J3E74DRAFT_281901 [Bipolaris maydis]KAJ6202988.1 hypothetical protein J3E72DRAFT_231447 [Bipolaris maydis]